MIKLRNNTKMLVFAAILTLGSYLLIYIQPETSLNYYIIALSVNLIIFFFELLSVRISAKSKLNQIGLPAVTRYSSSEEFIYHQLLPIILFASFNIFIFFNPVESLEYLILFLVFFSFFVIFINIRAYYEDKFKLEQSTHFIYAFSSIFGLFSILNGVLNVASIYELMPFILIFALFVITIISNYTLFIQDIRWNVPLITYILISSAINVGLTFFLYTQYSSVLRSSFMSASFLYLSAALIQHKQEATLDRYVIFEYCVIMALSFILLYGIS